MAAAKLVTVTHPTFEDVTEEVSVSDVDAWVASGWVAPAKKPSTDD